MFIGWLVTDTVAKIMLDALVSTKTLSSIQYVIMHYYLGGGTRGHDVRQCIIKYSKQSHSQFMPIEICEVCRFSTYEVKSHRICHVRNNCSQDCWQVE